MSRRHPTYAAFRPLLMAGVLLVSPGSAPAQVTCGSMSECRPLRYETGLAQELRFVGVNALLGGATAAAVRLVQGEPVWEAFWAGAVGGGVVYAGKRIVVEDFDGAGFLGRELASVGGSMVRNVTAGRAPLEELVLPLGPVRLYVSGEGVVPRLDVATMAAAGAHLLMHDARLDARASLSAGALVFRGSHPMPGMTTAGTMMVWERLPASEGPRLMAHERVHLVQYDQAFLSWAEPAERWLAERSPLPRSLMKHLDVGGLVLGTRAGLALALPYGSRPWEREAYFLAELSHPVAGTHTH